MNKFAVITSIFQPSEAVKQLASLEDWQVIVVGDKKTPADWHSKNVIYLSPSDQMKMGMSLGNALPWNHYSRKMMGYLFAIQRDADIIADIDDDNIPLVGWGNLPAGDEFDTITDQGFVNIYRFFSEKFIWPRGFPLDKVQSSQRLSLQKSR
jgi:hypothetical protein